ncbi:septum formation family protein [Kribbella sp. NPDC000426]|uniref:septum formation family protein n=1 Tax=Kribbella sp. NPDC000426 TaxID=3154255 RepID=UPI00332BB4C1
MPDPIVDELRRLAGPELYRRNVFMISGLAADADGRTTRQVSQRLRAALEMGADVDLGTATSNDPHEIQAACDLILGDPRRRLVHEVFAPWGTDVSGCGCPVDLHKNHDLAVKAHSTAIARELSGAAAAPDSDWTRARQNWGKVVPGLARHLESRVRDLDDRQLDHSAVEEIRRELPRALTQPAVDLAVSGPLRRAARLVSHAQRFPKADALHRRLLMSAATPLYEELEDRRTQIAQRIGDGPVDPLVGEIEDDLLPRLERLDALLPPGKNPRTSALHDQLAILLNNCAVELMNRGELNDGRAQRYLERAATLAIEQHEQSLVRENRQMLDENRRAMEEFRSQVDLLYRVQGKYAAQRLLRQVRRETQSPALRSEIDQMLAGLSAGRSPASQYRPPTKQRPPNQRLSSQRPTRQRPSRQRRVPTRPVRVGRRRRGPVVARLLVLVLIGLAVWHWWPREVNVYHDKIADNPPVGTCLGKQADDWLSEPTKLRGGDCDKPHWGEVLAYVQITKAPAPYPGAAQTTALANFFCGEALVQQGFNETEYVANAITAPAEFWNTGKNSSKYENYAACVMHRHDSDIPAIEAPRPDKQTGAKPVSMSLFTTSVAQNAPVGTCVRDAIGDRLTDTVKIVRCSEWHWAQIVGYPTIYTPGQRWPGDNAVIDAAQKACARQIPSLAGFSSWAGSPDSSWWKDPKQTKYAYCLVHRADDKPFKGALK